MDNNKIYGEGTVAPGDTEEHITVKIEVHDCIITNASYDCTDEIYTRDCAKTVCEVIKDKDISDIMQMDNYAVMFNTENDLPREKLYLCAMAVMAAKRAAKSYFTANGIPCTETADGCGCI